MSLAVAPELLQQTVDAMADDPVIEFLKAFEQRFENRLSAVERELNHTHKNMLTGEQAREIFRSTTLRVNTWTRVAVAVIAALAIGSNGAFQVISNHNRQALAADCELAAQKKIDNAELRNLNRDRALARDAAREMKSEFMSELDARGLVVVKGKP